MNYLNPVGDIIESNICGIPCQIQITHFKVIPPSYSHDAPSDLDYYGYSEIEFNVLDRKGYPAKWLERKLTADIEDRIQMEILEYAEAD